MINKFTLYLYIIASNMENLTEKYLQKLQRVSTGFVRSLMDEINWEARLIGIKGPRGVGKTTLLLQYLKLHVPDAASNALYVSLDDIWFSKHTLVDLADRFVKRGGQILFLDEVHKYANWSQELKNIYDDYPDLKVVFTGSSLLEILNARADLSRRAVIYHMQGLSFREYLCIETGEKFGRHPLEEVLQHHSTLAPEILAAIRPLKYFNSYLQAGYYPFYQEVPALYNGRLEEVINMMLEIELPLLRKVDLAFVPKIKQLLLVIAESPPFIPNISKLSEKIGLNRATMLSYLHYLEEIGLTKNLFTSAHGISRLQKPNKVLLDNPNLAYALGKADIGTLRETFFVNQLNYQHQVSHAPQGDFVVSDQYTFEVGGKNKTSKQLEDIPQSYVAADDIEFGFQHKIPLWLFGFLY